MDIAKQIFELHGVERRGRVMLRKTLRRERVFEFFAQLKPCEVGMEACGGAHYWHREISNPTQAFYRTRLSETRSE